MSAAHYFKFDKNMIKIGFIYYMWEYSLVWPAYRQTVFLLGRGGYVFFSQRGKFFSHAKHKSDYLFLNMKKLIVSPILPKFLVNNWRVRVFCGRGRVELWCLTPLQKYFSYFVAVSFIGGGNRSTRRKPSTCRKSLTNFIT
jgi:hypothetical protein